MTTKKPTPSRKTTTSRTAKAPVADTPTSRYILDTSREYSIYVCSSRAIPNIEDGLKHGQRIALWLLRNRAEKLKTSALSGLMAYERLYVHGDVSANNAIGLLAAPYRNNIPLVEGLGQFGSRVSPVEGIGAPRYTEVRRAKAAELILYRDLDLVPLEDNYDGSNRQPVHFLPLIPALLLNGVEGVAVGWSTSILPRNPKALIQATQDALMGKRVKPLSPWFNNFDLDVVERGPNQWEFRGRAKIQDSSTVHITELPPGLSIDKLRRDLIAMEEDGESPVVSFEDRSTEIIDVTVKFRRGWLKGEPERTETYEDLGKKHTRKIPARPAWTEEDAVKFFRLSEKVTERIVVIDWEGLTIKTYENAEAVVRSFAKWRLGWYTKRFEKLWEDDSAELTYWKILKLLFEAGFPKKLGTFADRAAMEAAIKTEIDIALKKPALSKLRVLMREDDRAINRVVNLPTYRWTAEFKTEIDATIKKLEENLSEYAAILENPDRLRQVYCDELEDLKKKIG